MRGSGRIATDSLGRLATTPVGLHCLWHRQTPRHAWVLIAVAETRLHALLQMEECKKGGGDYQLTVAPEGP